MHFWKTIQDYSQTTHHNITEKTRITTSVLRNTSGNWIFKEKKKIIHKLATVSLINSLHNHFKQPQWEFLTDDSFLKIGIQLSREHRMSLLLRCQDDLRCKTPTANCRPEIQHNGTSHFIVLFNNLPLMIMILRRYNWNGDVTHIQGWKRRSSRDGRPDNRSMAWRDPEADLNYKTQNS